jgi:hypothetical protein
MFRRFAPAAAAIDRVYTRADEAAVNLVLVTATESVGIHDPRVCFPMQGWRLEQVHSRAIGPERADLMLAVRGADRLRVMFWRTAPTLRREVGGPQVLRYLRGKLTGAQGESLLVRLSTPDRTGAEELLARFALELQPSLAPLKSAASRA